jgi:hypothetical protein
MLGPAQRPPTGRTGAQIVQNMRWYHISFIVLTAVLVAKFLGLI